MALRPLLFVALGLAASTLAPATVTAKPVSAPVAPVSAPVASVAIDGAVLVPQTDGGAARFEASVPVGPGSPALAWIILAAQGNAAPINGSTTVVEGVAKRRATFAGAQVTEVKFDDLDASGAKKPLMVDFEWQAETVEFTKGSGKLAKATTPMPAWDASSFRVTGLPGADASLVRASLPKLTITAGKVAIGDLALVFEGDDLAALQAKVKKVIKDGKIADSEYYDLQIDLRDQTLTKRSGPIAMPRCKLRSVTGAAQSQNKSGKATVTAVFIVEAFDPAGVLLQHK
jgi:hypothetical protein